MVGSTWRTCGIASCDRLHGRSTVGERDRSLERCCGDASPRHCVVSAAHRARRRSRRPWFGCLVGTVMPLDGGGRSFARHCGRTRIPSSRRCHRDRRQEPLARDQRAVRQLPPTQRDSTRRSRRTTSVGLGFRDAPRGNYQVTAILTGTGGRRAAVTRVDMVVSRLPR